MAALPSNVNYCTVSGKFLTFEGDGGDADRLPDSKPMVGLSVKFKPSVTAVTNEAAVPPVTIITSEIACTTDADGVLLGPDGSPSVVLVASDDTDLKPHGWTYKVTITDPSIVPLSFDFVAPSGGAVDLSTVVPVPSNPGAQVAAWQSVTLTVSNARDETIAARDATLQAIEDFEPGTGGGGVDVEAVQDIVDASIVSKADDTAVVKLTGAQTVAGVKTFSSAPVVPDGSFAQAKITGLVAALADKIATTGAQSIAGVKTFTDAPIIPTQAPGDNTQKPASTAFVQTAVAAVASVASPVWVVQWDGEEWVDPTPPAGSDVKIRIFDPMGHTDAPLYTGATIPGVTDYYGFDS